MTQVQLPDGRIREMETKKKAQAYATAMGGKVITKASQIMKKAKLKQFWERS